jgi:putative membrane protein insertion efficiency factor
VRLSGGLQFEASDRLAKSAKLMQTALIALLRFYKLAVSPLLGNRCRFYPSCSDYAREAIQYHGAAHGTYLAAKRLCRCHPFSAGGIDLVPLPEGGLRPDGSRLDSPFELQTELDLDADRQAGQLDPPPRSQPDSTPAAGTAPEHHGSTDFIPHGAPNALIDRH